LSKQSQKPVSALTLYILTISQYGVLVFRDTGLDDTRHVEFSKRFGDLDDIKPYLKNRRKAKYPYYELFESGNLDDEGKPIAIDSQRSHYIKEDPPPIPPDACPCN
jgi:alpha-ketoglutarate-dependent 2,4-dichlorophenoxyacetate dioxygenase